jgi:serine/threonine protein kinase
MNDSLCVRVADCECSVGVVGTRFWRAPEILLGIKNRDIQPYLFTKEPDVYSYAMTCYEISTGRIPFEELRTTEYS